MTKIRCDATFPDITHGTSLYIEAKAENGGLKSETSIILHESSEAVRQTKLGNWTC